jgi:hypothetical protein
MAGRKARTGAADRERNSTSSPGWIDINARPYLTYLALTGRLWRDWGWLLGIDDLRGRVLPHR